MRGKRVITFLLALSFVFSTFYLPVFAPTPRVQAQWAVIDVKAWARELIDGIGMVLAQEFIDQIVSETVNWANSGFEGNPVYAVDPKQFFTDIADGVAGEYIFGETDLGFLCSPFKTQIRIALANYYIPPRQYQCTLTDIADNISGFANDLDEKGWDNWYVVTQNPANNPYGAYLEAQIELDRKVAEALNLQKQELDWGEGFLNTKDCLPGRTDPDTGQCLEYGPTKTPGATIKAQLDKVLPADLEKLITANHIEQLIGAVAVGLLKRFVFSQDGLFSGNQGERDDYFSRIREGNSLLGDGVEADKCASLRETGVLLDANCNPIFSNLPPGTETTAPNNYGCVGIGCTPCSGTDCGVGETVYGDPAINGVYAGQCLINIVASYFTRVVMTATQCNLVNKTISDGITFTENGAARGGTCSNAIKAVALVCGGSGGDCVGDVPGYICGFP